METYLVLDLSKHFLKELVVMFLDLKIWHVWNVIKLQHENIIQYQDGPNGK